MTADHRADALAGRAGPELQTAPADGVAHLPRQDDHEETILRMDRALAGYQAALAAVSGANVPSLAEFLR